MSFLKKKCEICGNLFGNSEFHSVRNGARMNEYVDGITCTNIQTVHKSHKREIFFVVLSLLASTLIVGLRYNHKKQS